ncbi:MAG: radical SAM protein [Deltaproteobacteria bacterium]|jgi:organic radical activating enzyme|nr:radical SAM protein [Deltaproteobacteria bacterium]
MINILINRDCQLSCPYCFVKNGPEDFPRQMSKENFESLTLWLKQTRTPTVGLLGGEPTLHPNFSFFLDLLTQNSVGLVLFTNALYPENLNPIIAQRALNVVVNYNHPSLYGANNLSLLQTNLSRLKELGASFSFSKNFYDPLEDFNYLLEAAERFKVKTIRLDISRPAAPKELGAKVKFNLDLEAQLTSKIIDFMAAAKEHSITTGLDCCARMCLTQKNQKALALLRNPLLRFFGVCRPALDVLTDLSCVYCLPLSDYRLNNLTAFDGEWELLSHFGESVAPLRANRSLGCLGCEKSPSYCQGGCLAYLRP